MLAKGIEYLATVDSKTSMTSYKDRADVRLAKLASQDKCLLANTEAACFRTMSKCCVSNELIDLNRQILEDSNPNELSELENLQREQIMLVNDARAGKLTKEEYTSKYNDLRKRERDLLHRLTGRVINQGYGLNGACRVILWFNFMPLLRLRTTNVTASMKATRSIQTAVAPASY